MKFHPYKKGGGAQKVLAMLNGGGIQSFEVVLTLELVVLAILKGSANKFSLFRNGGREKFYPFLKRWGGGGTQKATDPGFSHFINPTLHNY